MARTWTEGWLPDGTHIHVDTDPYTAQGHLSVNGEVVHATDVRRYRDGGTTVVVTERGTLYCARKIGQEHFDTWDGVRLASKNPTTGETDASS